MEELELESEIAIPVPEDAIDLEQGLIDSLAPLQILNNSGAVEIQYVVITGTVKVRRSVMREGNTIFKK